MSTGQHHFSKARRFAMQFLYQCECEKIFFFQDATFGSFSENFDITGDVHTHAKSLVKGVFNQMPEIDAVISSAAENWSVSRLAMTDRAILRMAIYEMNYLDTPKKVVINEAIDLAKLHGTEKSGGFVNAVLDKIYQNKDQ